MPNLLAMSFEGALTPAVDLHCLEPGRTPPDGWGLACYPGGEPAALVLKEATPSEGSLRGALVSTWERLESPIFVLHIRTAKWGALTEANTQPFHRAWGRRDWVIAHSGSLEHKLDLKGRFEPVGSTDSEQVLCELLDRAQKRSARAIGDIPAEVLHGWLLELNRHGALTIALSDGRDLAVYSDGVERGGLFVRAIGAPHGELAFGDDDLTIDLTRRGIRGRKGLVFSSAPLDAKEGEAGEWRRLEPGQLVIVRHGAVIATQSATQERGLERVPAAAQTSPSATLGESTVTSSAGPATAATSQASGPSTHPRTGNESAPGTVPPPSLAPFRPRARPIVPTHRAERRRYEVHHHTAYRYATAVERSAHLFRLFPRHDLLQRVVSCEVSGSVGAEQHEFEDVFGNRARRVIIEHPYRELVIDARSVVELLDVEPLDFRRARVRTTIPLAWMPWQRQVLEPFLLPPELPESELAELHDYAMTFASRNDFEVLDALIDLNSTIFSEYEYKSGSTTLTSSAFDCYTSRRGVCQDFANLFICLARLLGVPARYVCGYLYTGPQHPNARMADASHAWVEVYLPEVGWKGFDPTNGVLTQTEHVRVAVGRNYRDATPTSGVIYVGGGGETLSVAVRVTRLD
jgi:transglutaminase-like putative cysteine protease/predicted glutamine amidotransferase